MSLQTNAQEGKNVTNKSLSITYIHQQLDKFQKTSI